MTEQIKLQKPFVEMIIGAIMAGDLRDVLPVTSSTDVALMLAVKQLDKGKGVSGTEVQQFLNEKEKDFMPRGTVYTLLHRLQDKGLLTSFGLLRDEPQPGRPKAYFMITPDGELALHLVEIWMRRKKS